MKIYFSKRKRIFLLLAAAIILTPARAQAVTDEQKAKLDQIDKYIERQVQQANDDYAIKIAEISASKANRQQLLGAAEGNYGFFTSFAGQAEYTQAILDQLGVDLRNDPEYAKTFSDFRKGSLSAIERLDLTPRLLAIGKMRLAKEANRELRGYDIAEIQALQAKNYILNVELPEFREQLRNNVLNPPQAPANGTVSGVVYSDNTAAAVVGTKVVHEGEKIGDIKVVKINAEGVVFEKGGRSWTQKIGEAASSQWQ